MGYRIVRVSKVLLEQMLTTGTVHGAGCVVTSGLPEGARLEMICESNSLLLNGDVTLRFSHPSWPDTPEGEHYPEMRVEFTREVATIFQPPLLDELIAAKAEELRAKLERAAMAPRKIVTLPLGWASTYPAPEGVDQPHIVRLPSEG